MQIYPNVGVGPIRFGMTIEEVRHAMGYEPTPFRKSVQSQLETDAFDKDAVHVFYRPPGVCEAVESFPGAVVGYQAHTFFGRPFAEIRDWLLKLDPQAEIKGDGMTSFQLGIALDAPAIKAPQEPVGAVLVFEPGYYNRKRL